MAPHLPREGTSAPHGATIRDFFANILTSSPSNAGEQAEAATLIRLYVHDTIRGSILQAHIVGDIQEEHVSQSSTKRGREENEDTEGTNASVNRPHTGALAVEDPL